MSPIARRPAAARFAAAVLAGAVAASGLAPLGLWPLTLLALLLVPGLFLAASGTRAAALTGWAFGAGYFAHALFWIVEPFLVEPDRHGWMAPFALVFLAGGLALFWAAGFAAAHALGRGRADRVLALVLCWTLAEIARAVLLTGFPWAALAQVWVDTDARLLLAWIGPQGLALATLLVTLPAGAMITGPGWRRWAAPAPALLLIAVVMLARWASPEVTDTPTVVRLVQPNAPQDQKWDPAMIPVFFDRQIAATAAPADTGGRPDLIVWPETAIPVLLGHAEETLAVIAQAAEGVPVVFGVQRRDGVRIYNSLAVLGGAGAVAGIYDKHHLVPFGEYVPLGDLAARFGLRGFAAREGDGYSAGPGPRVLALPGIGPVLPLICYEAVFPREVNAAPERPAALLQITNDAWFGTRAGPYQHLAQARMRAAEQGLPMVRVANTGVSAVIDPLGRVTASLPLGATGFADAALPAPFGPTAYARLGDGPLLVLLAALALALIWRRVNAGSIGS
ncbi:apolipoprotein N-acyltransferase [Pukyongiella litopenaei]|uniref:Apolipoprotein N-acyltransferase n=1 Tax=Pukyongiella litopenaei TaxID=2605946 RepID=A0A2S0MQK0_9RHOB|nr:apolipoprotein N-acyltransferase [Pukyongiella litopenaei]AVO38154.1 apolipoprotein N-acyltransferase [Pukyongiella litopenaei]